MKKWFDLSNHEHTLIPVLWRLSFVIGKAIETMNHYREKWELLLSERRHSDVGPVFDPCGEDTLGGGFLTSLNDRDAISLYQELKGVKI